MKSVLFVLLASLTLQSVAHADQDSDSSFLEVLSIAKIAGACGILDSLITFQKTTKIVLN